MKVYRLEYQMHIGNGPQAGSYEQLGGFTISEAKKAAWLAENPSHTASVITANRFYDFDVMNLDSDEQNAYVDAFAA